MLWRWLPSERSASAAALAFAVLTILSLVPAACGGAPRSSVSDVPAGGPANSSTSSVGEASISTTIVEPDDSAKPLVDFIDGARSNLDVGVYLLSDTNVLDALKRAQGRGVTVRVMLEEHPVGGGRGNATISQQLAASGMTVKWSNPVFTFTHEKIMIRDHSSVAIMTLNLTRSAIRNNREFAVVADDPSLVADVQGIFDADWTRTSFQAKEANLVVSRDNARPKLKAFIDQAQRSLDIYAEEMKDQEMENVVVAAARRGARVRLIMTPAEAGEKDTNASGRAYLQRGGVQARLLGKPYIHAKAIVVDGQVVFLGSQNFSETSLNQNREIGLIVADATTLARVQATFERDWAAGTGQ